MAPSVVTLSILVKLLAKCHEWEEVKELLDTAPVKLGLPHECRLYTQLAQACIRERQGKHLLEVVKMMLQLAPNNSSANGRLLGLCAKFNMFDTAAQLLELLLKADCKINPRDANELLSAALQKKKAHVVRTIYDMMGKHGVAVNAQLRREALSGC